MDRKSVIDYLKCPFCNELYENPKLLPCGHNTCERCLKCHIIRTVPMIGYNIYDFLDEENPDIKPSEQSFKCPIDKKELIPQNPTQEVSKWASQFENNLKLVTLVEICQGKVRGLTEECDICIEVSQKVAATSVCFKCIEKYCVKCAVIHRHTHSKHLMFNLSAIQCVLLENQSPEGPSGNSTLNETCKLHLFSEIDLYCSDCKETCCRKCKQTIHSECRHVSKLSCNEYQTNGTLTTVVDRFKMILDQTSTIMKNDLILLEKVKTMSQSESKTKNIEFDDMKNELQCQITRWEVHYEHAQKTLKCLNKNIDATAGVEATIGLVQTEIECQQVEKEIEYHKKHEVDNCVRLRQFNDVWDRQTRKNPRKNKNTNGKKATNKNVTKLEEFDFDQLVKFKTEDTIVDITEKVKLVDKLDMKCDDDSKDCWLTDCLFLNVGFVVVVDKANKCIKWKVKNGDVNKLALQADPHCIAYNLEQSNMGCVTLPENKTIQFFYIQDGTIYLTEHYRMKENCYGVDFWGSNMVVSCKGNLGTSVKILTLDRVVIRDISCSADFLKEKLFSDPQYLTVQQSGDEIKIYVADFRLCSVTCISLTGIHGPITTEKLTHNQMGFPLGLDTDKDGNVLFCCNSRGSVQQITNGPERQYRQLVGSLWQPRAVSALKRGNMFIVTSDSGPNKNHVLVHEFISKAC